jgi:hypothetical protein
VSPAKERHGDWLAALTAACGARGSSQAKVALRLGVSAALVNQVLRGKYKGSLANIEQRVRGELMAATVGCPILGEISSRRCLDEQARPFAATNPTRVALYHECHGMCPHSRVGVIAREAREPKETNQ